MLPQNSRCSRSTRVPRSHPAVETESSPGLESFSGAETSTIQDDYIGSTQASLDDDNSPDEDAACSTPGERDRVVLQAPLLFDSSRKKRKLQVDRRAPEWSCITITSAGNTPTPVGTCNFCGKTARWTASRIKDHVLGQNGSRSCSDEGDEGTSCGQEIERRMWETHCFLARSV